MSDNTAIRKAVNDFLKVLKEKSIVSPVKKISTRIFKNVKHRSTSKHDETQTTIPKTSTKKRTKKRTKTSTKTSTNTSTNTSTKTRTKKRTKSSK